MECGPGNRPMCFKFGRVSFYVKLLLRTNSYYKTLTIRPFRHIKGYIPGESLYGGMQKMDQSSPNLAKMISWSIYS